MQEGYEAALHHLNLWSAGADTPGTGHDVFKAQVLLELARYDEALASVERALATVTASGREPNARWLEFRDTLVRLSQGEPAALAEAANTQTYHPIVKVQPIYPQAAKADGVEGYVVVEFTVSAAGDVEGVKVVEAQPQGVFEQAALRAAERFKYRPHRKADQQVPVHGVRNRIVFSLAGS